MKTIQLKYYLTLFMAITFIFGYSQEEKRFQMYEVHEDQVKPSKVGEYEKAAKNFADKMKEHQVSGGAFLTTSTSNLRYLYVNPIDSLGQRNAGMAELWEKMGQEAFGDMMSGFDGTYDRHGSYVIVMDKELCYMPEGLTQTPEGQNYRKFYYVYYKPEHGSEMREAMKGIKDLFEAKKSKVHYRVYRSGYGTMDEFYMVAVAAKDPVDMAQRSMDNQALLGEDAQGVWDNMMKAATKLEDFDGWIRPELGYNPSKQ